MYQYILLYISHYLNIMCAIAHPKQIYYFTTTDQLDDINLRLGGASANKDGFATVMLKLEYSLK